MKGRSNLLISSPQVVIRCFPSKNCILYDLLAYLQAEGYQPQSLCRVHTHKIKYVPYIFLQPICCQWIRPSMKPERPKLLKFLDHLHLAHSYFSIGAITGGGGCGWPPFSMKSSISPILIVSGVRRSIRYWGACPFSASRSSAVLALVVHFLPCPDIWDCAKKWVNNHKEKFFFNK